MGARTFPTALGPCALSWEGGLLTGFQLPSADERATLARLGAQPTREEPPEWVAALVLRAQRHLGGDPQDYGDVELDWSRVGPFEAAVYRHTRQIPAGSTRTYGEIARLAGGGPGAGRAVGAALGANPWPLIVPCHRVVAAGGKMTGFSAPGGIRTKTRLLAIEGAQLLSE